MTNKPTNPLLKSVLAKPKRLFKILIFVIGSKNSPNKISGTSDTIKIYPSIAYAQNINLKK